MAKAEEARAAALKAAHCSEGSGAQPSQGVAGKRPCRGASCASGNRDGIAIHRLHPSHKEAQEVILKRSSLILARRDSLGTLLFHPLPAVADRSSSSLRHQLNYLVPPHRRHCRVFDLSLSAARARPSAFWVLHCRRARLPQHSLSTEFVHCNTTRPLRSSTGSHSLAAALIRPGALPARPGALSLDPVLSCC